VGAVWLDEDLLVDDGLRVTITMVLAVAVAVTVARVTVTRVAIAVVLAVTMAVARVAISVVLAITMAHVTIARVTVAVMLAITMAVTVTMAVTITVVLAITMAHVSITGVSVGLLVLLQQILNFRLNGLGFLSGRLNRIGFGFQGLANCLEGLLMLLLRGGRGKGWKDHSKWLVLGPDDPQIEAIFTSNKEEWENDEELHGFGLLLDIFR